MPASDAEILLISDLHLSADQPDVIKLFSQFVRHRAVFASALYILGDFFEYWLGDDDPATGLDEVFSSLELLANKNIPVYFMRGNRDFLVHEQFEKRCCCKIIDDPTEITINKKKIVLMHGDSLCTDDIDYQTFKKTVRSKEWIKDFLSRELEEREAIVSSLRQTSKSETAMKQQDIMDVNEQTVLNAFIENDTQWLIHGHTHRPGIHHYQQNNSILTRIVLGDWHRHGSVLSLRPSQSETGFTFELQRFD